jgi:hypothetical protein
MLAKKETAPPDRRLFEGKLYGLLEDTFAVRGCSKQTALKAAATLRRGADMPQGLSNTGGNTGFTTGNGFDPPASF